MRRRKRHLWLFAVSLLSIVALAYLVLNYSPSVQFTIYNLQFTILPIFFVLLLTALFSLFGFVLNNTRRGILIGLFAVIYLILRLNNLTHPFFLILLLILFGSIELLFRKRK